MLVFEGHTVAGSILNSGSHTAKKSHHDILALVVDKKYGLEYGPFIVRICVDTQGHDATEKLENTWALLPPGAILVAEVCAAAYAMQN